MSSPHPPPLREARFFVDRLEQEGLHLAGVVVNRVDDPGLGVDAEALHDAAARLEDGDAEHRAVAAALSLAGEQATIAARQRRDVDAALVHRHVDQVVAVPRRPDAVHDLHSLHAIAHQLAGPPPD